ncbi:MAG TPA: extracellular solute-binding protein [Candidatus Binatia bacterium]|jgi:iron(III) transport system substrate-binding protein
MQRRYRFAGSLLIAFVFLSSAVAPGAAVNDPAWGKIVAAGKKEGKVVVFGPAGADVRDAFTQGLQKKYPEIEVDFSGMQGAQVAPKLLAELSAKQYRTDIVVAGTTTMIEGLVPVNAIVPLEPFLVGPESRDPSKWRAGKFHFSDDAGKYNLFYGTRVQVAFVYNKDTVSPGKIKSWRDLLNPEWKGKIAMLDPRRAGAGLDLSTFWYTNEKLGLGKSFMKQLFTAQEIFFSNEERQILDFVARGRYLIAIGPSGTLTFQLKAKGLPLELFGGAGLQEGGSVTASNGTVSVVRNAPHPNATKVYVDYLLSKEGQTAWSQASGLASLRSDVPRDHIPEILLPQEGVTYQETHREKYVVLRKEIVDFINSVLPPR